jgi:putative ABC transport system permease protein
MITYFIKLIGQFLQDMRRQKLRTFFTVFGITWGTVAVVLLLGFGQGLQKEMMKNMRGMGNNVVIFGGKTTTKTFQGLGKGRWVGLREEDARVLKENIPYMEFISPENNRQVHITNGRNKRLVNVVGVYPGYGPVRNLWPRPGGRFINEPDHKLKRRMVFIGDELSDQLFGEGSNAVGRTVLMNSVPFKVVGVMAEKTQNSAYMGRDRGSAFIPFSAYSEIFSGRIYVNRFICRAARAVDTPRMKKDIYKVLGRKYKFDPTDEEALWMWDTTEGQQFMTYFFLGFQIFLGIGGLLTLLVGGIGVANIMYVVVRERRREIGIKTALGATPNTILLQFMTETFFIVAIGAITGFAISYGVVEIFQSPLLENIHKYVGKPEINPLVASCAMITLGLVGFAAGWSPARRAASIDPVQALEF